ncbi:hypothetical protein SARC_03554 [Sphaeroforma arctica JP610]|uniref:Uncharacterized protein n=1 Tax=Sphaeroforma arctica JP610 TaxID=667725 RepID=A0A0L0G5A5_9EUKA|nr:hypothetical protein SARC_03554 [Sphaeroforma arctica JP610]KNC84222.1 hypothetical protein SARC_03554 [Sphaeroforma arctica JP610]|eukprot:XP_014158124.1 hypothetical protein SARC_03554 [Sphaeroforma arctica JP610]
MSEILDFPPGSVTSVCGPCYCINLVEVKIKKIKCDECQGLLLTDMLVSDSESASSGSDNEDGPSADLLTTLKSGAELLHIIREGKVLPDIESDDDLQSDDYNDIVQNSWPDRDVTNSPHNSRFEQLQRDQSRNEAKNLRANAQEKPTTTSSANVKKNCVNDKLKGGVRGSAPSAGPARTSLYKSPIDAMDNDSDSDEMPALMGDSTDDSDSDVPSDLPELLDDSSSDEADIVNRFNANDKPAYARRTTPIVPDVDIDSDGGDSDGPPGLLSGSSSDSS